MRFSDLHLRTIFTSNISSINHENYLQNYLSKSLFCSTRDQWVNQTLPNSVDFKDIYPGYNWYYAVRCLLWCQEICGHPPGVCVTYNPHHCLPNTQNCQFFTGLFGWLKIQINSSSPSAAYMHQWTGSALVQIVACCLMAPSHYLNQCWLISSEVQWHSSEDNFHKQYLIYQSRKLPWKLPIWKFVQLYQGSMS